jgi:hypothetical protein
MNRTICAFTAMALTVSFAQLASGGQSGTAAEAKAMLERAVTALKANEAAALSQFNDRRDSRFHDRDLCVFCNNLSDGKMTAHPNHALIGMDAHAIRGDLLMQRINDALKDIPEGRVANRLQLPQARDNRACPETIVHNKGWKRGLRSGLLQVAPAVPISSFPKKVITGLHHRFGRVIGETPGITSSEKIASL